MGVHGCGKEENLVWFDWIQRSNEKERLAWWVESKEFHKWSEVWISRLEEQREFDILITYILCNDASVSDVLK